MGWPKVVLVFFVSFAIGGCYKWDRLSAVMNPASLYESGGPPHAVNMRGQAAIEPNHTWSSIRAAAAAAPFEATLSQKYLDSGIALSDELCSAWFKKLGEAQARVNADRDIISNVGALTAVIMSITAAPTLAVGAAAGATGFAESLFESESINFIVAPSVSKVQAVMELQRAAEANRIWQEARSLNFYQADVILQRYDNSCSHLALKRIVDESVSSFGEAFRREETSRPTQLLIANALANIDKFFSAAAPLNADDLFILHAILNRPDIYKSVRDSFVEHLKERKIMNAEGKLNLDAAKSLSELRTELYKSAIAGGFDARVDKLISTRNPAGTEDTGAGR